MKTKVIVVVAMGITVACAFGRIIIPFSGWTELEERSPDIIIVSCERSTLPPQPHLDLEENAPTSDSAIRVLFVLKGTNVLNAARLVTDHRLWQGENYLVFGYCSGGIYQAYEQYRVIPLGISVSTNSIAGKPLDEQIRILFKQRIAELNQEIQKDLQEKRRLEEALIK